MTKIVLVGGGTGVAELVSELKQISTIQLTAVVTVFDDGASTGRLRRELKIAAVGDLRKVISASLDQRSAEVLESRPKDGHPLGNLLLAFLTKKFGLKEAVNFYSRIVGTKVEVLPVSFANSQLVSEFEGQDCLVGEAKLDQPPVGLRNKKIYRVRLSPPAKINPEVVRALKAADKIIVGPGSLFGSLLANFAVSGFSRAFVASPARKILVLNAGSEFGCRRETPNEVQERFKVRFDQVLQPDKGSRRWQAKQLVSKILG